MTPAEVEANSRGCYDDGIVVQRLRLLQERRETLRLAWRNAAPGFKALNYQAYRRATTALVAHKTAHPWLSDI